MERLAVLIQAVAALLWPMVALYALHRRVTLLRALGAIPREVRVVQHA